MPPRQQHQHEKKKRTSSSLNFSSASTKCLCDNAVACRGLTAAFSMLGGDPRRGFTKLPIFEKDTTTQYAKERNLQRAVYLRYLLPNHHDIQAPTRTRNVALHHFHPRVVARLVSSLEKTIPRTMTLLELQQLNVTIDERDCMAPNIYIFAPSYPIHQAKEDLKRLLRLCQAMNTSKQQQQTKSPPSKPSKSKRKQAARRKFQADIATQSNGDAYTMYRMTASKDSTSVETTPHVFDSLAEHNIPSLLETMMHLDPIPEDHDGFLDHNHSDVKVESMQTLDTDLDESDSDDDDDEVNVGMSSPTDVASFPTLTPPSKSHPTAAATAAAAAPAPPETKTLCSMQVRLEQLHAGKGSRRPLLRKPGLFFEISVISPTANSEKTGHDVIYRSYPLQDATKNASWDPIEALDLGSAVGDVEFKISLYSVDTKSISSTTSGGHAWVGSCVITALELIVCSSKSIPILRDDKIKGFCEISHFQLYHEEEDEVLSTVSSEDMDEVVDSSILGVSRCTKDKDDGETDGANVRLEALFDQQVDSSSSSSRHQQGAANSTTLSMQLSLETLRTSRGKAITHKVRNKKGTLSPFFEISIRNSQNDNKKDDAESTPTWNMLYRSYPLTNVKGVTTFFWDAIENVAIPSLHDDHDVWLRIDVLDCNVKKDGKHRLIGSLEKTAADLSSCTTQLPIQRGTKVKGFLKLDRFEIYTPDYAA